MTEAVLYLRVSTKWQAEHGHGLDAQRIKLQAWLDMRGISKKDAEWYEDSGVSGGKAASDRDGANQAIMSACKNKCPLIVTSLSRIGRSLIDVIETSVTISKAGADLVVLDRQIDTTNAQGRLMFHIFAAFAQCERELTSERTRDALAAMRANGLASGSTPPYGKMEVMKDGVRHWVTSRKELKMLQDLMYLFREYCPGTTFIVKALNESDHKPRKSSRKRVKDGPLRWHRGTVDRLIARHSKLTLPKGYVGTLRRPTEG